MTKELDKFPRTAARGRLKRRPTGLEWTPERRARQAELIRSGRPWLKSTGPKTEAGKARCAVNALKHRFRSRAFIEQVRQERQLIRDAASTIALAKTVLRALSAAKLLAECSDRVGGRHPPIANFRKEPASRGL